MREGSLRRKVCATKLASSARRPPSPKVAYGQRMSSRLRLIHLWSALALLGTATSAFADDPMSVDARVTTYAQYFQQGLVPGLPGAVARVEPSFPLTLQAFLRVGSVDLPGAPDSVSGEVSAWGSLGPRDGRNVDADVTAAWAQYRRGQIRVKLGRQVTLPGSSRYVRFDGAALGVTLGVLDIDGYAGWVALPRWTPRPGPCTNTCRCPYRCTGSKG